MLPVCPRRGRCTREVLLGQKSAAGVERLRWESGGGAWAKRGATGRLEMRRSRRWRNGDEGESSNWHATGGRVASWAGGREKKEEEEEEGNQGALCRPPGQVASLRLQVAACLPAHLAQKRHFSWGMAASLEEVEETLNAEQSASLPLRHRPSPALAHAVFVIDSSTSPSSAPSLAMGSPPASEVCVLLHGPCAPPSASCSVLLADARRRSGSICLAFSLPTEQTRSLPSEASTSATR